MTSEFLRHETLSLRDGAAMLSIKGKRRVSGAVEVVGASDWKKQVTLPVAALAEAHVKSGDILRVEVEDDGIFRLIRHRDPRLDLLAGAAPGLAAATNLQELRDEWERWSSTRAW